MGPEDVMKATCWVVIEGTLLTITDVNGSLYYIFVISVVKKSMLIMIVYKQKLSNSSHVCRGLYRTEGVGYEWVLAVGVVRDTST